MIQGRISQEDAQFYDTLVHLVNRYTAPFAGNSTKSLELNTFLKLHLMGVLLQQLDFVTPYCKRNARGRCLVFSISCFLFIFCFGDVNCEAFIAKYFGLVKGTCKCGLIRVVGLALRINMCCRQCLCPACLVCIYCV